MKKSIPSTILIISIFILACSSANLLSLATAIPQTIITMPPMPGDFITQPPSPTESTQTGTGLENENLSAGLPDGFKIGYQAEDGNQTITEMVAEDETIEDWTIMLTV